MAFSWYKSVTIASAQCGSSDSTDFPVTIWVTDADLATVANGGKVTSNSGYDIRPYSDVGLTSALTFELVANVYDPTSGKLEMHVKIPTLSHTSDTVFYLAFGDSGVTTDGSSSSTWDSHFLMVLHYPNGTGTPSFTDSSQSGHILAGSATAATGQIDGGIVTSGSSYPTYGTGFTFSAAVTVSQWTKLTSKDAIQEIFSRDGATRNFQWRINASNLLEFIPFIGGSPVFVNGVTALTTGTAFYSACVNDGSNGFVYLNGAQDGTLGTGSLAVGGTDLVEFYQRSATIYLNSDFSDEFRWSDIARSASWLLSEYNNQKAGSTFLTWGAATAPSSGKRFFLIPN